MSVTRRNQFADVTGRIITNRRRLSSAAQEIQNKKEKLRLSFEDEEEPSAIRCVQISENMELKQPKYGTFYSLLLIIFGNHHHKLSSQK